MRTLATLGVICAVSAGCSNYELDTFEAWCDQINGVDMYTKYSPSWSVIPAITTRPDAIRDDLVEFQNAMWMEKADGRTDRMVWREGKSLYMQNPANLFAIDADAVIAEWEAGFARAKAFDHPDEVDRCLYGGIQSLFDEVVIETVVWGGPSEGDVVDVKVHRIDMERDGLLDGGI